MEKILGFEKFTSKKGTACCNVYLVSNDVSERLVGNSCRNHMFFGSDCDRFQPECINREIRITYGMVNGQIRVTGFDIANK